MEISKRQLYALCALPVSLLQSAAAERLFAMLASDAYYACLLRQLPTDELMQVSGMCGVMWGVCDEYVLCVALCALPVSLLQSAAAERLFAMLASDAYYARLLRQLPTDEIMQVSGICGVGCRVSGDVG